MKILTSSSIFALVLGATPTPLLAQTAWTRLLPSTAPSARSGTALVWDEQRGRGVLYGGVDGTVAQGDTWEWDGTSWLARNVSPSPGILSVHAMAYDSSRGVTVLFGGARTSSVGVADTWEWNGTTWSQRSTTGPTGRAFHQLCFDKARGVTVLFGGIVDYLARPLLADTWEWIGGAIWVQRTPAQSPSARWGHAMAYDVARQRVVLFGGNNSSNTVLNDTWEYDGNTWIQRMPAQSPPARWNHGMVWDAARGRIVIFSGNPPCCADTWEYDGTTWTQRVTATSPFPARAQYGFAFDTKKRKALLFGGYFPNLVNETWEYGPSAPADLAPFGAGCAGSAGTPQLDATSSSLPWLGDSLTMQLSNLPPFACAGVLGASKTAWGSYPLPLDLALINMPGCKLFVSLDAVIPLVGAGGTAPFVVPVPNDASLVGGAVYAQGLAVSPGSNPTGVVVSNAMEIRIGAR